jgi:hypothetical protein
VRLTHAWTCAAALLSACRAQTPAPAPRLLEKGPYQALYAPDGVLERLAYDADGDSRADVVTFYAGGGRPLRAEVDSDLDGKVDRWEVYGEGGKTSRLGSARRGGHAPDLWSFADGAGGVSRREYDDDGDGRFERAEDLAGARTVAEELDGDGDGRRDRRIVFGEDGSVAWVEADADGDGLFERLEKARPEGTTR